MDQITNINGGLIHHGKQNSRVYVMKAPRVDQQGFITQIEDLAKNKQYEKIIAKIPDLIKEEYTQRGYHEEAHVPNFYSEKEACSFMVKYLTSKRKEIRDPQLIEKVIQTAKNCIKIKDTLKPQAYYISRKAEEKDIGEMATIYRKVFKTYPFPIHEEAYIRETMGSNVMYFGIWHHDKLIGLSSSEIDWKNSNSEMTDFAVDPDYRGQSIATILLQTMEQEMKKQDIRLLYTIARSVSYGMNCTFSKNGYAFSGTLFNNTQISGNIESMNVWYKRNPKDSLEN